MSKKIKIALKKNGDVRVESDGRLSDKQIADIGLTLLKWYKDDGLIVKLYRR